MSAMKCYHIDSRSINLLVQTVTIMTINRISGYPGGQSVTVNTMSQCYRTVLSHFLQGTNLKLRSQTKVLQWEDLCFVPL